MIYFTSDFHFGDERLLQLRARKLWFNSIKEMDNAIIKNINDIVKKNDTLFILGDIAPNKENLYLLDQINCETKHLLIGNYDTDKTNELKQYFKTIKEFRIINAESPINLKFGICHKPVDGLKLFKKNTDLNFIITAHIHDLWKVQNYKVPMINVGVDCWNFKPVSLENILFYYNAILNHYDNNVFPYKEE